jgi:hypothetical protein
MSYTGEKPVDPLIFEVLPFSAGQKTSNYSVYEDSGKAETYRGGEFAQTRIDVTRQSPTQYEAVIAAAQGTYDGMAQQRAYELRLDSTTAATSVTLGGHKLKEQKHPGPNPGWCYDKDKQQIIVLLPSESVHQPRTVKVTLAMPAK